MGRDRKCFLNLVKGGERERGIVANRTHRIHTAHSPAEFVTVSDLEEAVEGYKKLIVHNIPGAGNATANATAT